MEVPIKKDDKDLTKILLRLSKIAKLFVYSIQRLYTKYVDFIDNQYIFFLLVHLHPPVDMDRTGYPEPVNVRMPASA